MTTSTWTHTHNSRSRFFYSTKNIHYLQLLAELLDDSPRRRGNAHGVSCVLAGRRKIEASAAGDAVGEEQAEERPAGGGCDEPAEVRPAGSGCRKLRCRSPLPPSAPQPELASLPGSPRWRSGKPSPPSPDAGELNPVPAKSPPRACIRTEIGQVCSQLASGLFKSLDLQWVAEIGTKSPCDL
jgi:hypothetical protein